MKYKAVLRHVRPLNVVIVFAMIFMLVYGCSEAENPKPIPESHPAYGFYQIAQRGPTTLAVCESYGGKEIYPNDYEPIESLGQGIFTLREISTGKKYLGVSFGEGKMFVTIKTCYWEVNN